MAGADRKRIATYRIECYHYLKQAAGASAVQLCRTAERLAGQVERIERARMTKANSYAAPPARLQQIKEFLDGGRFNDAELEPLAGDASFRRYVRVRKGKETAILMDAPPEKENVRSYVAIAEYLRG